MTHRAAHVAHLLFAAEVRTPMFEWVNERKGDAHQRAKREISDFYHRPPQIFGRFLLMFLDDIFSMEISALFEFLQLLSNHMSSNRYLSVKVP